MTRNHALTRLTYRHLLVRRPRSCSRARAPIPTQYHVGMGKQLTVRLPDALVEFIDQQVEHGEATSRAAVVAAALDQQRRQEIAERDAAILARAAADGDDLDDLAAFAAQTSLGDLA